MQAKVTDDPVGDFIDDTQMIIRAGRRPFPIITGKDQLEMNVRICNGCSDAINTIPAVWKRYQRWVQKTKTEQYLPGWTNYESFYLPG